MSSINIYLGAACDEWADNTVNEIAINEEVSMERAALMMLEKLLEALSQRTNDQSYLDDSFGEYFGRIVYSPRMAANQYKRGDSKYPMIHVAANYVIHRMTGDHWPITEEVINHFGRKIEDSFGLEFLGFEWTGVQKMLNFKQAALF